MRDPRRLTARYSIESTIDPEKAAALLAGEQSSGTFIQMPGESDELRSRHGAEVTAVHRLGEVAPSLPSRSAPERVTAAVIDVEFPMENVGADLATTLTAVAGNLFELGVSYEAWQKLARLAGTDNLHASGLGSKFYERDDEVSANVRHLLEPLGSGEQVLPALSSGQNVFTPHPTWDALHTTDLLMLAGGGIAAHPDGPAAGVQSLRDSWAAAVAGETLEDAAAKSSALGRAVEFFGPGARRVASDFSVTTSPGLRMSSRRRMPVALTQHFRSTPAGHCPMPQTSWASRVPRALSTTNGPTMAPSPSRLPSPSSAVAPR